MEKAFLKTQMNLFKRIIEIKKEQRQDKKKKKGIINKLFTLRRKKKPKLIVHLN